MKNEVDLSEFEEFVEDENPIEVEVTFAEKDSEILNEDSDEIVENKEN